MTCNLYDYSLRESARINLISPNKFICTCVHCHKQAIEEFKIVHTEDCCFIYLIDELEKLNK